MQGNYCIFHKIFEDFSLPQPPEDMLQYNHMRYIRCKKPLLAALFLIFTVSMALVSKNVVYAEETVEPTKKECSKDWKLEGNKDSGYKCTYPSAGAIPPRPFECPSGSGAADGEDISGGAAKGVLFAKKCVKGAASPAPSTPSAPAESTVEPTKKECSSSEGNLRGDKTQGYWCEKISTYTEQGQGTRSRTVYTQIKTFECPAGSTQKAGETIRGGGGTKQKCVVGGSSSTLTPEQKQKVKEAEAEASGKDLLSKSPELAKITSDPKVVGECLVRATARATATMLRLGLMKSGSRASLENNYRRQFLAECLSEKTGKSVDEIKAALEGIDLQGSVAAGESARAATEQQLAQEQAAGEEENKGECGTKLDTIGYFVCPLLEKLVEFADGTWGLFELLLQTDPLPNEEDNALRSAWNGLRDVANAILAIIFLAIIISQVSNVGISNYGVKKMLPRLIIAAIAINMSYFLMQVIVDVANILGANLYHFISDLAPAVDPKDVGWGTIITDIIAGGIVIGGGILAGKAAWSAAAGMDAKVGLLLLLVFIVPAILGLIAGLMALVFRAGIIPVLAISSPIAIAAWVLPNTQKLFEKWKSTFLGMVFLYPLASMYCGGLKFMALIILNTKTEANEVLFRMMAVTMLLLGTGFVAVLAIKSNSIMGGMINGIKNAGNKLTAPAVNSLSSYAGAMAGAAKARRKSEIASRDYSKETEAERLASRGKYSPLKLATRAKYAMGRRRQSFDQKLRAAKAQEAAFEQESQRKFDARVADDPSILGKAAQTVGGKAYIKEAAFKAAGMELQSKYNGNAVRALNESNDSYVKALAAKEIAERGSASEIDQVREYLQKGGSIDNSDMAEALMKMKGRDAGIAAAGKAALDKLEKSGGAPVHTGVSEMHRLTQEGFDKLGDKAAVEQNAAAIQAGGMDWQQAARVLGDRHIMREAPQENIGAIKASIQANITQQIKSGTMDGNQAQKVLNNSRAMENISDQTRQELQNIVNNAAKQAQASGTQAANGAQTQSSGQPQSTSSGAQPVTSSGQARQAQAATQSPSAPKPPST